MTPRRTEVDTQNLAQGGSSSQLVEDQSYRCPPDAAAQPLDGAQWIGREPPCAGETPDAHVTGMTRLARYAVTASYLRPQQLQYRLKSMLRRRLRNALGSGSRDQYTHGARSAEHFKALKFPNVHSAPVNVQRMSAGEFTFLNRKVQLGNPIDWFPPAEVRLWLYTLHYWHYATSLGCAFAKQSDQQAYEVFRDLVRQWVDSCPVATPTAWDAYPTSLRLANWMRAYRLFEPRLLEDSKFAAELRRSMYIQSAYLEKHLEYDLLNNHLLENGRALLLAGLAFEGRDAQRWRRKGERILWDGLKHDFLPDGGHDERSPMYHQAMLELYQEVAEVLEANGEDVPELLIQRLPQMRQWLRYVCHPDGEIALLNDAAFGMGRPTGEMLTGRERVEDGLCVLADSGYYTIRNTQKDDYLIFDCGPLGPDHQPGHGHCDALSYELSIAGRRIVVDSGVSTYHGELAWRNYYRSTRAHNTVVVDGAEQSEIWDRFRVARRASVINPRWSDRDPDLLYVSGAHSGYRRLKGNVTHRRWVCWVAKRFWLVCDHIDGHGSHHVESLLHFHPDTTVVRTPSGPSQRLPGTVRRDNVMLHVSPFGEQHIQTHRGELSPIQGWYAPEFGLAQKNHVWSFCYEGTLPSWMGYVLSPEDAAPTVESMLDVDGTLRVTVQAGRDSYDIRFNQNDVILETPR